MSDARLPAHLEVAALRRAAESAGGFATVVRKGDPDRGSLVLQIVTGSQTMALLERTLLASGLYGWRRGQLKDGETAADWVRRRTKFDPDLWWIELDIAQPERFIVENALEG